VRIAGEGAEVEVEAQNELNERDKISKEPRFPGYLRQEDERREGSKDFQRDDCWTESEEAWHRSLGREKNRSLPQSIRIVKEEKEQAGLLNPSGAVARWDWGFGQEHRKDGKDREGDAWSSQELLVVRVGGLSVARRGYSYKWKELLNQASDLSEHGNPEEEYRWHWD